MKFKKYNFKCDYCLSSKILDERAKLNVSQRIHAKGEPVSMVSDSYIEGNVDRQVESRLITKSYLKSTGKLEEGDICKKCAIESLNLMLEGLKWNT